MHVYFLSFPHFLCGNKEYKSIVKCYINCSILYFKIVDEINVFSYYRESATFEIERKPFNITYYLIVELYIWCRAWQSNLYFVQYIKYILSLHSNRRGYEKVWMDYFAQPSFEKFGISAATTISSFLCHIQCHIIASFFNGI